MAHDKAAQERLIHYEALLLELASRIGIDRALQILHQAQQETRVQITQAGFRLRPQLRLVR